MLYVFMGSYRIDEVAAFTRDYDCVRVLELPANNGLPKTPVRIYAELVRKNPRYFADVKGLARLSLGQSNGEGISELSETQFATVAARVRGLQDPNGTYTVDTILADKNRDGDATRQFVRNIQNHFNSRSF